MDITQNPLRQVQHHFLGSHVMQTQDYKILHECKKDGTKDLMLLFNLMLDEVQKIEYNQINLAVMKKQKSFP